MKFPVRLLPLLLPLLAAAPPLAAQSRPRHGALMINEFYRGASTGTGAWVEIYNPNPFPVDASGATVIGYADDVVGGGGTYVCDSYLFPGGTTLAAGALQSVSLACPWGASVLNGGLYGQIAILDAGGVNGWDYLEFNEGTTPNLPPNLAWTGGDIVMSSTTRYARRLDDLDADNAFDFAVFSSGPTQGAPNPGQLGPHAYDELADESAFAAYSNQGRGVVIDITRPCTIRELKFRVNVQTAGAFHLVGRYETVPGSNNYSSPIFTLSFPSVPAGDRVLSSGATALGIWSPGRYLFQLYGADYSLPYRYGPATEQFRYGTVVGDTEELNAIPNAGTISVRTPGTAVHSIYFLTDPGPQITSSGSLLAGEVGFAYGQTLAALPGTGATSWALNSGTLPPGLTLNANGTLTGTPTTPGSYSFSARACDPTTCDSRTFYLPVVAGPPFISTGCPIPEGEVGRSFTANFYAIGGVDPYAWSSSTGLAPGLSMSPGGALAGTPGVAGGFATTLRAVDYYGAVATDACTHTIWPQLTVPTASLPGGSLTLPYSQRVLSAGGKPPYAWQVASGALPPGVALIDNTRSAQLAGRPSQTGTFNFTLQVSDALGVIATRALSISVGLAPLTLATNALPVGVLNASYPATALQALGGAPPYSYSLIGGALPAGIGFSAGALSGTPTALGTASLTFQVTDSLFATASRTLSLTVAAPAPPAEWTPRGVQGGVITGIIPSPDYANDRTLFALGRANDLVRTTNAGSAGPATWVRLNSQPVLANGLVRGVVLSPDFSTVSTAPPDSGTLLLLNSRHGVWKSTDRGASFTAASNGLPCSTAATCQTLGPNLLSIAISPDYPVDHTLWIAYGENQLQVDIYRSADGGANWAVVGQVPTPDYRAFGTRLSAWKKNGGGHGLLAFSTAGIHRSDDDGATWQLVRAVAAAGAEIVVSPDYATDQTILASLSDGALYRSTDGGFTFYALGISGHALAAVTRPALTPLWIYNDDAVGLRVMRSTDALDTAIPLTAAGVPPMAEAGYGASVLAAAPASGGAEADYYAGTDRGIFGSYDAGYSFRERESGVNLQSSLALAAGGARLHATSASRGAEVTGGYRSLDNGVSWTWESLGASGGKWPVAYSPDFATDRVVFLTDGASLYRSLDGGLTSVYVAAGAGPLAFAPNFNPATGTVFMGGSPVQRSDDGGQTFGAPALAEGAPWSAERAETPDGPGPPPNCYGTVRTLAVSSNYANDGTVFRRSAGGLCKSTNRGVTWTLLTGYSPFSGAGSAGFAISPDYSESGANGTSARTIVSALDDVSISRDGGATWQTIPGSPGNLIGKVHLSPLFPQDGTILVLANPVDLFDPSAGYASYDAGGVWRSGDAGASIAPLGGADQLKNRPTAGLAFAAGFDGRNLTGSVVTVSTDGSGFYRSTDGGRTFTTLDQVRTLSGNVTGVARVAGGAPGIVAGSADPERPAAASAGELFVGTSDQGVFVSADNGVTFAAASAGLPPAANAKALAVPTAASTTPFAAVSDAAGAARGLWKYSGADWTQVSGANVSPTGNYVSLLDDGTNLYAARADGVSIRSSDGGANWTALDGAQTDLVKLDFNNQSGPTLQEPAAFVKGPVSPALASGTTAALWAVAASAGPRWSSDGGASWTAAPGSNDYTLPGGQSWTIIRPLGINPLSGAREVVTGSAAGLWLTRDGGDTWKSVSATGSGLEASSKNFSAVLSTATAYGTDLLVGATGATTGGVFLSADGGEHWTQVNQGFDPAQLSISTLAKSSCAGCPVQYYSGSYGGGLYTRTITVVPPPALAVSYACWGATGCSCGATPGSGPVTGGQAFKLCGGNFQNGLVVEFDGIVASGCTQTGGTAITCTGTPAHVAGYASVRVRNPDTRVGYLPAQYQFTGGSSRAANSLRVAKSGANANLTWTCGGCSGAAPGWLYRAQNAAFTLYQEQTNVGTAGAYTNIGAVGSAQSYFWSVE